MITPRVKSRHKSFFRSISLFLILTFSTTLVVPPEYSYAQNVLSLPAPGTMVSMSPVFTPPILKGIKIHPENPLKFDFIVDKGDASLAEDEIKRESTKLIKYFLASLTIPEQDLWVNLSPYEKERIIPNQFGLTEMGRDLLAQDYILKQLTASLIYPENELGKKFWDRVYAKAQQLYGKTEIPMNTFNKVWIIPDKAVVFETGDVAFVAHSHLKVMLEEDYLAASEQRKADRKNSKEKNLTAKRSTLSADIIREVILPEIEKEVNEGKNFAQLRQIYNSLILATWFKQALKESLLGQVYVDKGKISGINLEDKADKERIYEQYLEAYKKGVYNYIKEDVDPASKQVIPRKYFSGGANLFLTRPAAEGEDPALLTIKDDLGILPSEAKEDMTKLAGEAHKGDRLLRVETRVDETGADGEVVARQLPDDTIDRLGNALGNENWAGGDPALLADLDEKWRYTHYFEGVRSEGMEAAGLYVKQNVISMDFSTGGPTYRLYAVFSPVVNQEKLNIVKVLSQLEGDTEKDILTLTPAAFERLKSEIKALKYTAGAEVFLSKFVFNADETEITIDMTPDSQRGRKVKVIFVKGSQADASDPAQLVWEQLGKIFQKIDLGRLPEYRYRYGAVPRDATAGERDILRAIFALTSMLGKMALEDVFKRYQEVDLSTVREFRDRNRAEPRDATAGEMDIFRSILAMASVLGKMDWKDVYHRYTQVDLQSIQEYRDSYGAARRDATDGERLILRAIFAMISVVGKIDLKDVYRLYGRVNLTAMREYRYRYGATPRDATAGGLDILRAIFLMTSVLGNKDLEDVYRLYGQIDLTVMQEYRYQYGAIPRDATAGELDILRAFLNGGVIIASDGADPAMPVEDQLEVSERNFLNNQLSLPQLTVQEKVYLRFLLGKSEEEGDKQIAIQYLAELKRKRVEIESQVAKLKKEMTANEKRFEDEWDSQLLRQQANYRDQIKSVSRPLETIERLIAIGEKVIGNIQGRSIESEIDPALLAGQVVSPEEQSFYVQLSEAQIPSQFGINFGKYGLQLESMWISEVDASGKLVKPSSEADPLKNIPTLVGINVAILQAIAGSSYAGTLAQILGRNTARVGKYGDEIDASAVQIGREALEELAKILDIVIIVGGNEGSFRDESKDMPIGLIINPTGKNGVYMYFGDSVEVTNGAKREVGRPGTSSMVTLVPLMQPSTDGYRISLAIDKFNPNKPFPAIDPIITSQNTLRHIIEQLAQYLDKEFDDLLKELTTEYTIATLDRPKHDQLKAQAKELGFSTVDREDGDPLLFIRAMLGIRGEDGKKLFAISTGGANEHIMSVIFAALLKHGLIISAYAATKTLKAVDKAEKGTGNGSLERAREFEKEDLENYEIIDVDMERVRKAGFEIPPAPVTTEEISAQILNPASPELQMLTLAGNQSALVISSNTGANKLDWGVLQQYIQPVSWTELPDGSGRVVVSGFFINNEGKVNFFRTGLKSQDVTASRYTIISGNTLLQNPLITKYEVTRKPYMDMLAKNEIDIEIIRAHVQNIFLLLEDEVDAHALRARLIDALGAVEITLTLEGEIISAIRAVEEYILGVPSIKMEDGSVHLIVNRISSNASLGADPAQVTRRDAIRLLGGTLAATALSPESALALGSEKPITDFETAKMAVGTLEVFFREWGVHALAAYFEKALKDKATAGWLTGFQTMWPRGGGEEDDHFGLALIHSGTVLLDVQGRKFEAPVENDEGVFITSEGAVIVRIADRELSVRKTGEESAELIIRGKKLKLEMTGEEKRQLTDSQGRVFIITPPGGTFLNPDPEGWKVQKKHSKGDAALLAEILTKDFIEKLAASVTLAGSIKSSDIVIAGLKKFKEILLQEEQQLSSETWIDEAEGFVREVLRLDDVGYDLAVRKKVLWKFFAQVAQAIATKHQELTGQPETVYFGSLSYREKMQYLEIMRQMFAKIKEVVEEDAAILTKADAAMPIQKEPSAEIVTLQNKLRVLRKMESEMGIRNLADTGSDVTGEAIVLWEWQGHTDDVIASSLVHTIVRDVQANHPHFIRLIEVLTGYIQSPNVLQRKPLFIGIGRPAMLHPYRNGKRNFSGLFLKNLERQAKEVISEIENELVEELAKAHASGTYRKPVIGYNFKGEFKKNEVEQFLEKIADDYQRKPVDPDTVDVIAFFSFGHLDRARQKIDALVQAGLVPAGFIKLGAQDIRVQPLGPYTAHVPSIEEVEDLGADAVLVGHSEVTTPDRGDPNIVQSDEEVNAKARAVINYNADPEHPKKLRLVIAYGEAKSQRDAGKIYETLASQLAGRLDKITAREMLDNGVVLAYEPVWAIGTGVSATPEDAQQLIKFSRDWLSDHRGPEAAAQTPFEYGGSMSPDNVAEMSGKIDIDGGLIGGASKKAETAIPIYRTFAEKKSREDRSLLAEGDKLLEKLEQSGWQVDQAGNHSWAVFKNIPERNEALWITFVSPTSRASDSRLVIMLLRDGEWKKKIIVNATGIDLEDKNEGAQRIGERRVELYFHDNRVIVVNPVLAAKIQELAWRDFDVPEFPLTFKANFLGFDEIAVSFSPLRYGQPNVFNLPRDREDDPWEPDEEEHPWSPWTYDHAMLTEVLQKARIDEKIGELTAKGKSVIQALGGKPDTLYLDHLAIQTVSREEAARLRNAAISLGGRVVDDTPVNNRIIYVVVFGKPYKITTRDGQVAVRAFEIAEPKEGEAYPEEGYLEHVAFNYSAPDFDSILEAIESGFGEEGYRAETTDGLFSIRKKPFRVGESRGFKPEFAGTLMIEIRNNRLGERELQVLKDREKDVQETRLQFPGQPLSFLVRKAKDGKEVEVTFMDHAHQDIVVAQIERPSGETLMEAGTIIMDELRRMDRREGINLNNDPSVLFRFPEIIAKLSVGENSLGGIDFNPANLELQIKRDGRGVPLPINNQPMGSININGLAPVIINIVPMNALPFSVSALKTEKGVELTKVN